MFHLIRSRSKRLVPLLVALGLGLGSLPATSWAPPIPLESSATVTNSATVAPLWYQDTSGDFTVALLNMWASVADQLSNYQDAIASEAYLGTACSPPC